MTLAVDEHGPLGAPPVVLVHGFTQNARCWGPLLGALTRRHRVRAVDAPGHGRSPSEHDRADIATAARLIGEAGGPGTYVGYSMGGRLCLRLACDRPDLVGRLVLIGATPGLRSADERAARRAADDRLAAGLERDGLEAFLDRWLALPLFSGLPPVARALPERLTNRPEGLAASLRRCGTGNQEPLWDRLGALAMPVLAVVGGEDAKFGAIAEEMAAIAPRLTIARIPAAGHTAHLEQPDATIDAVLRWLAVAG